MLIKNISMKIINIAGVALLPDADMPATDALENNPAVKALVKAKQLTFINDPVMVTESEPENADDEKAKPTDADDEKAKPTDDKKGAAKTTADKKADNKKTDAKTQE